MFKIGSGFFLLKEKAFKLKNMNEKWVSNTLFSPSREHSRKPNEVAVII